MPLILRPDLRLNAEISGPVNGMPLVLLHALGTDLSIWEDLLPLLPQSLRILRLDLRGHGKSDAPPPPYPMGALIRDVETAMEHFGLRDAAILGVSLGGLIAQGLAVKRLDLVRALILSNTAAKIGSPALWQARGVEIAETGLTAYAPGAMLRMFGRNWADNPAMPRVRALLEATSQNGWTGGAKAIAGADFYATTATLTLPTLVIAGANDATTPPDLVRETADLIRGSRFHLIRGVGHLPFLEKPRDYATLVSGFLQDIGHG